MGEVETEEITTPVAAVGAIQAAVDEDDAAVVVLHLRREIDFFGLDATTGILVQLYQSTAHIIGRGGEYQAVLVDWRGTINTHAVGRPVIPPKELAVGRRDRDEPLCGELHVLACPSKSMAMAEA